MSETEGKTKIARLVTFLGLGRYDKAQDRHVYDPAEYEYQGRRAAKTPYVCRALAELLEPPDVVVLATDKAEEAHGAALREALRVGNFPAPRMIHIPTGQTPAELWKQFDLIKTELRDARGSIMLDITNGFRSQPFFAAAVTAFVRAVDYAPPAVYPPDLQVCYAAYDPSRQESSIWELTEFVKLLDWSRALAMFLRTGRAQEAAKETAYLGRRLARAWADQGKQGERPSLDKLGTALRDFGADLETQRTGDLLIGRGGARSSALRLFEAVKDAKHQVEQHAPPLADILDRASEIIEPLARASNDLSGKNGREVTASLAKTYLRFGRYSEAAATVREGYVNFYAPKAALRPGSPDFDGKQRRLSEDRARLLDPVMRSGEKPKPDEQDPAFSKLAGPRNDLLHAQYNKNAQASRAIIQKVEELVEEFERASCDAVGACFVNFSNHPSEKWDDAQTRAALDLSERIVDIEFPAVPPDADEKTIGILAEKYLAEIPREATHVLVQGEFTLTVELVRRLQSRGVTCLAATSTRNVEEEAGGRKVSSFTFVRFRAYPELGSI